MNFHIYQIHNHSADNNQLESAIHENKTIQKHFFISMINSKDFVGQHIQFNCDNQRLVPLV